MTNTMKRKIESKAPGVTKTSKLEVTETKKKAQTKNELMVKYNDLLKVHEDLIKVHKNSLLRIDSLEKDFALQEKKDSSSKQEVEVQTDDSETCNECEFPARDIWELGEHIYEFHTLKSYGEFECSFCHERFGRKKDLMEHRKREHVEKVGTCRSFNNGTCAYGSEAFWWSHAGGLKNQNQINYTCSLCDKVFQDRAQLMKHRKVDHEHAVSMCNHALNGTCHFGSENCWFRHNDSKLKNTNEKDEKNIDNNQEVLEKLFEMMEKFSDRIVHIESIL